MNTIIDMMNRDSTIKLTRWGSKRTLKIESGEFLVSEPKGRGRNYHKVTLYQGDSELDAVNEFMKEETPT